MKITIEADNGEYGESERFRLQNNNTWRSMDKDNLGIKRRDKIYSLGEKEKVAEITSGEGVLILDDLSYYVDPETNPFIFLPSSEAVVYAALHRSKKPRRFTRRELSEVIASQDDNLENALAIDIHGGIKVIRNPGEVKPLDELSYAVVFEPWIPGESSVGKEALKNKEYLEGLFLASIDGWRNHLYDLALPFLVTNEDYEDALVSVSEKEVWDSIDKKFKN